MTPLRVRTPLLHVCMDGPQLSIYTGVVLVSRFLWLYSFELSVDASTESTGQSDDIPALL